MKDPLVLCIRCAAKSINKQTAAAEHNLHRCRHYVSKARAKLSIIENDNIQ